MRHFIIGLKPPTVIATALILTFANYHKKTTFTDTHSLLKKLMLNAA